MVSQEPRTIRFQFMDIGTQTVSGLLTIFPGEAGAGARIFVSVEGERLRPEGHYTVEVTGDGLSLTASFTADADGRGSATKATVGHVPPTFRPRFAVVGPGF